MTFEIYAQLWMDNDHSVKLESSYRTAKSIY